MPFIVPLSSSSCFVFLNTQTPKKKEKHYTTPQKYTTHYQKTHTHTTTITHPPTPLSDNILPPLTLPHSCVRSYHDEINNIRTYYLLKRRSCWRVSARPLVKPFPNILLELWSTRYFTLFFKFHQ